MLRQRHPNILLEHLLERLESQGVDQDVIDRFVLQSIERYYGETAGSAPSAK
jgi:hypothetical protein